MTGGEYDGVLIGGVDIGGTMIKIGLVTPEGEVRCFRIVETPLSGGDAVVTRIAETLEHLAITQKVKASSLKAIGMGAPALVDLEKGVAMDPPNLPSIHAYPLRDRLAEKLGVKVYIDNDANAFAQAEACFGIGRHYRNLVCLTLGTGIGGGAIIDGRVLRGAANAAAEFGHLVINFEGPLCKCGARGCVEAYASKYAINDRAREAAYRGLAPQLRRLMEEGRELSPELVHEAAKAGDTGAARVLRDTGRYLGEAIGSLVCALSPEYVILGGGVAGAREFLLDEIRQAVHARVFPLHRKIVKIEFSNLGREAGMLGAAAVAMLGADMIDWHALPGEIKSTTGKASAM